MSMRGTITSRTGCSPSSMTLVIISRSSSSRSALPSTRWRRRSSASAGVSACCTPSWRRSARSSAFSGTRTTNSTRLSSSTGRTKVSATCSGRARASTRPRNWASSSTNSSSTPRTMASHGATMNQSRWSIQKAIAAAGAHRQRVDEQDRRQAAGRLVEQAYQRAGARRAFLEHVPQARTVDVHQRRLGGRRPGTAAAPTTAKTTTRRSLTATIRPGVVAALDSLCVGDARRAGAPSQTSPLGMSWVTTEPAAVIAACADVDRRHQHRVAANRGVVFDDGAALGARFGAVVDGDRAGADVDPLADVGVADIAEVVHLRARRRCDWL